MQHRPGPGHVAPTPIAQTAPPSSMKFHADKSEAQSITGYGPGWVAVDRDRKSTRLNSSHLVISYAVFCLKKKKTLTLTYPVHHTQSRTDYHHQIASHSHPPTHTSL